MGRFMEAGGLSTITLIQSGCEAISETMLIKDISYSMPQGFSITTTSLK
jgi:hypothetical protein